MPIKVPVLATEEENKLIDICLEAAILSFVKLTQMQIRLDYEVSGNMAQNHVPLCQSPTQGNNEGTPRVGKGINLSHMWCVIINA